MKQRPTTAKPSINAREIKEMRELDSAQYQLIGSNLSHFQILNELGKGSYGIVYKVKSLQDGQVYVLKKINLTHLKPKHQAEALKEAQLLRKLKHPNIITYYMSFIEQESLCIIMEYAEGGDLQRFLKEYKERRKYVSEDTIWEIGKEISSAIQHLHENNIIHRDIKALNVFLTKDRKVKLGDLGVSKIFNSDTAMQGTRVGTPLYLSPELVQHQPYDFKVDVWALGCVIFYMASLEPPFQGENLIALGYSIVNRAPKALPPQYSQRLTQFIWKLLEKIPVLRPTMQDVNMTYFRNNQQKIQVLQSYDSSVQRPQTSYVRMQQQDTEKLKKTKKQQQNQLHQIEPDPNEIKIDTAQLLDQTQKVEEDRQLQKIQQYQQMIKEQQERLDKDRMEREKIEKERMEKELKEKLDQDRLERERLEKLDVIKKTKDSERLSSANAQHRILKIQQNEIELFIQDIDDQRRSSITSDNKIKLELKTKPNPQLKGSVQIRPLSAQARGSSYTNLVCKPKLFPVNSNTSQKEVKKFTIFDLKDDCSVKQMPQQYEQQQQQQQLQQQYASQQEQQKQFESPQSVYQMNQEEEKRISAHSSNNNQYSIGIQKPKDNARVKSAFILQYSGQNKKGGNYQMQQHIVKHYTLKDLVE